MWPERGEALSRTIDAESAIADLYAEALRRWAPAASAVMLPALTAASLPPDPDAVTQTQSAWDQVAEEVVLAGLMMLWAVSYAEAAEGLGVGVPLPPLDRDTLEEFRPDPVVLDIIARATDTEPAEVRAAAARVQAAPQLAETAREFAAVQRATIADTPAFVRDKVSMAVAAVEQPETLDLELRVQGQRAAAAEALTPGSPEMRDIARVQGYQAAGVMNAAVIEAARGSDEELQKVWICTIDGKTRPSHWAADGQRVDLESHFTVGGEQLFVPGDKSAPPAEWKNCRCRVGVLALDEELPDEVDRHTERLDGRDSVAVNRHGRTQAEEIARRRDAGNVRARDDEDGVGRVASAAPTEEITMDDTFLTFTDVLFAVVGTPTSDGRVLSADTEMKFRSTPMPLRWCEKSKGAHDDAVVVGVIEQIGLNAQREVRGSGYVLNNKHAVEAIDLVQHGVVKPSIDYMSEEVMTYEDGTPVTEENFDPERRILRASRNVEVMAATLVSIPAFGQTTFALNSEREPRERALVASAAATFAPPVYDPALFTDPKLSGPTRVTISEDGHVYGHLACWKDKHRTVGLGHMNPPRSRRGYAHFHSSPAVHLSDGSMLSVGRLTVGIGHAPTQGVSNSAAQAHYDNAAHCWALVRAGEDAHGIWVSGVVAPWATAEQVQMAMSAPLSGDWRPYGGDYELVAVLSVNTPGFLCAGSTRGEFALVASLGPSSLTVAGGVEHLSGDDIKAIVASALEEHTQRAELGRRRAAALERARDAVGDAPPEPTAADRVRELMARANAVEAFGVSGMPAQLKKYWLGGAGAAKIRWGTPGDFNRCVRAVNAKIVENGEKPLPDRQIKGLCADLHREATGAHPGQAPGEGR